MCRLQFSRLITCLLFIFSSLYAFSTEENFILMNGVTDEVVLELGPHIHARISPCSTFKITLSLMGYDAEILRDEQTPLWDFQEGYDDSLESWKGPQTPCTWMKCSCLWYSKLLALQLGMEKIQSYLALMEYGNQDLSGGLGQPGLANVAWIKSSLAISPKEQVDFMRKMVQGKLPVSPGAFQMTKSYYLKRKCLKDGSCMGEQAGAALTLGRKVKQ